MSNQATIQPISAPEQILLTPEEINIVDLISSTIIKKTFEYETGVTVSALQQRRTEQSQHRAARHSNKRMDEAT